MRWPWRRRESVEVFEAHGLSVGDPVVTVDADGNRKAWTIASIEAHVFDLRPMRWWTRLWRWSTAPIRRWFR